MRPGEENLDGPPIHGNTRLEVIWTAIPAILLVGLCTYAFVVLEDVEAAEANPLKVRVVGEQFAWTFFYAARRQGGRLAPAARADRPAGQVHAPVQGRAARLLGAGLPHEEGRGAGHRRHLQRHAEPDRRLPDRLRGAVRPRPRGRCARPRSWSPTREFAAWLADARQAAPAARRRRRRRRPAARRRGRQGALHAPRATAARATRWPTRAPTADRARTSTRCSRARTRRSSRQSIVDPSAEIATGYQDGIMPPNFERHAAARPSSMRW